MYNCVDCGGEKCPCPLMKAGQCYTCGMIKHGKCVCDSWKGVCPYSTYMQLCEMVEFHPREYMLVVDEIKTYSAHLKVIALRAPRGLVQKCRQEGSFLMVDCQGYKLPLSVLSTEVKDSMGEIRVALQPAGIKSSELAKKQTKHWVVSCPYSSGLEGADTLNFNSSTLVVAKGNAIAPYINIAKRFKSLPALFVDTEKLTEEFVADYLGNDSFEHINLRETFDFMLDLIPEYDQTLFLASPYYTNRMRQIYPKAKHRIITPNHANMCCGMGICGACSYTDENGQTVKKCKCI